MMTRKLRAVVVNSPNRAVPSTTHRSHMLNPPPALGGANSRESPVARVIRPLDALRRRRPRSRRQPPNSAWLLVSQSFGWRIPPAFGFCDCGWKRGGICADGACAMAWPPLSIGSYRAGWPSLVTHWRLSWSYMSWPGPASPLYACACAKLGGCGCGGGGKSGRGRPMPGMTGGYACG